MRPLGFVGRSPLCPPSWDGGIGGGAKFSAGRGMCDRGGAREGAYALPSVWLAPLRVLGELGTCWWPRPQPARLPWS